MVQRSFESGDSFGNPNLPPPKNPGSPSFPPPPKNVNLGGSPGLVTSTGGLYGIAEVLLCPFYDTRNRLFSLNIINDGDYDTEERCFYFFPSPDAATQNRPGIPVTVNNVVLVYREIGLAMFRIGVIVYIRSQDKFKFVTKIVQISNISPKTDEENPSFPDFKLHTKLIPIVIDGERPQVFIDRLPDSGPISIISCTAIGVSDVKEVMGGQNI